MSKYTGTYYYIIDEDEPASQGEFKYYVCTLFRPSTSAASAWKEFLSVMGETRKFWQTGGMSYKARKLQVTIEDV